VQDKPTEQITITTTPSVQASTTYQRITRTAASKTRAHKRVQPQPTVHFPNKPPALSTRSNTKAAVRKLPQSNKRVSRLHQPTKSSIQRTLKHALSAQLQSPKGRKEFIKQYREMEKEVKRAMMVLDEESGKILKCKQCAL
jgi:hypothetical protein